MMLTLWKKECVQTVKSLIYWLYVVCLVLFYSSQLGGIGNDMVKEPQPGQESYSQYGRASTSTEKDIMEYGLEELVWGYCARQFSTYPVGFVKTVHLNEEETNTIGDIICEMTGTPEEELPDRIDEYIRGQEQMMYAGETENTAETEKSAENMEVKDGYSYQKFLDQMAEVRKITGPGSSFTEENLKSEARKPVDYEGAKEAYQNLVKKDGYSGGYARLFCDYMGILLGVLPVFLIATRILRDKRAGMQELVFSRKASSAVIVCSRYAANVCMAMIPVILLSVLPLIDCILFTKGSGIRLDYLAFLKYDFGWLLPTVLVTLAVGIFFTELTESALAVLVQAIWWYGSISIGGLGMSGGTYGWNLIPRHNSEMNYSGFADGFAQLVKNRVLYTVLALVFVAATIMVYEWKRKGHLRRRGKILRNRKSTAQA